MSAPGRDAFRVQGDCWCPAEVPIGTLRIMGHTEQCTAARKGWEANRRSMNEMERQRAADREAGRQLREAAQDVIARGAA